MAHQARNNAELTTLLKDPLKIAVNYVVDKIEYENRIQINLILYGRSAPENYERTYEFERAWDTAVHSTSAVGHTVEGQFFYSPSDMSSTPPNEENNYMGQHHGVDDSWGDSRAYLADIIYQGLAGPAYGDGYWRQKRDVFSALLKYIGKARMKQWFEEGMAQSGLDYKRHNTTLVVEYG